MTFGLIGFPLGHSFSPDYFREKFVREKLDHRYEAFPLKNIAQLPELLDSIGDLRGFNVTTPHKEAILPYLAELSPAAAEIGAVNCVRIDNGRLYGYNTDWRGFRDSLEPLLPGHRPAALVLGTGGASKAIQYALKQMGIVFKTVSRESSKADFSYDALRESVIEGHKLIINSTTLGTEGRGLPPLPYSGLKPEHLLYDLVYNPPLTPFLQKGLAHSCRIQNGYAMLVLQAEASWQIWMGKR